MLVLEHGKPMIFGKNRTKGIKLDGYSPVVVDISNGKYSESDLLVHNEFETSPVLSVLLAHMTDSPDFPTPIGVFRQIIKPTYDQGVETQIRNVTAKKGEGSLEKLLFSGNTWEV